MTVEIQCPFCGETMEAEDVLTKVPLPVAENEHMMTKHREIIVQRLRDANMHQEADQLEKAG